MFTSSSVRLLSNVPFATALVAGVPVEGVDPTNQDSVACRLEGSSFVHKLPTFSRTSPFSVISRATTVLQSLLCLQKLALHASSVFGHHLVELRQQSSPKEFLQQIKVLERSLPSGHALQADSFEAFEELWLRFSEHAEGLQTVAEALADNN